MDNKNWKDLNLKTKQIAPNYTVYYTPEINIEEYSELLNFHENCINKLNSIDIPKAFIPKYSDVFIFNHEKFRELTNVPFDWAIGCIRKTSLDEKNPISYILSAPKYLKSFKDSAHDLQWKQIEQIHEYFHLMLPKVVDVFSTALDEGLCEAVPRYILGYETPNKEHTKFITSIKETDIITAEQLNEKGLSFFSDKTVEENIGYASSFLFAVGILKRIKTKHQLSKTESLVFLLSQLSNADTDNIFSTISTLIDISEDELLTETTLQKEALNIIGEKL
ncbi:MAG: hypothetical protein GY793_09835 [Proteobacteria bacterium]|nr:hypothetical protein [Pseudomonadota bacterium]